MNRKWLVGVAVALALAGAAYFFFSSHSDRRSGAVSGTQEPAPPRGLAVATFAGGCFWCMVHPFDTLPGVTKVVSGYTGGSVANPTYRQVSAGGTGHFEAVQVTFDPDQISYGQLLGVYWHQVDPFDAKGQFCDRGDSYRTAVFYDDRDQKRAAENAKDAIAEQLGQPVVTLILPLGPFYRAEDHHQDFYKKNAIKYQFYRSACGREARLQAVWGTKAP